MQVDFFHLGASTETTTSSQTGSLCVFVDRKERSWSICWIHGEPQSFRLIKWESSAVPTWCSWDRCLPEPSPTEDWWTQTEMMRWAILLGQDSKWTELTSSPSVWRHGRYIFLPCSPLLLLWWTCQYQICQKDKKGGEKKATLSLRIEHLSGCRSDRAEE